MTTTTLDQLDRALYVGLQQRTFIFLLFFSSRPEPERSGVRVLRRSRGTLTGSPIYSVVYFRMILAIERRVYVPRLQSGTTANAESLHVVPFTTFHDEKRGHARPLRRTP